MAISAVDVCTVVVSTVLLSVTDTVELLTTSSVAGIDVVVGMLESCVESNEETVVEEAPESVLLSSVEVVSSVVTVVMESVDISVEGTVVVSSSCNCVDC